MPNQANRNGVFLMQLQQAYETFIADKRINGCSKETIRFYNYSVGRLLSSVQKDRVVETDDLGPQINRSFLHLYESGLSPHSIQALFRGTRAFTRFLLAEGFIESATRLPRIKPTTSVIKPMSVDQMRTILTSIDTNDFVGLRNWTSLQPFFDTGMRLGEVCRLDTSHVNLDNGFVLVHGKGGRDRWVPVRREMKKALWAYMKRRLYVLDWESQRCLSSRTAHGSLLVVFRCFSSAERSSWIGFGLALTRYGTHSRSYILRMGATRLASREYSATAHRR